MSESEKVLAGKRERSGVSSAPAPVPASGLPARRSIALNDTRPIWQSLAIFLMPLMLSNVLQSLGQTANSIYLGRMVGVSSLAAVSAIFPIVFFLISFLIGLGAGSSVLIGQAYGARNEHKVKEIAGAALALTVVLGLAIGGLGAAFAHDLLAALGTPADIIDTSTSYAHITFLSIPLLFLFLMYTTFLRGAGDTRTPFFVLVASTALTFVLTPIFIRGWFGAPALGTNGAAIGNVCSNALALAGLVAYLNITKHPLAFDREMIANLRLRPALVGTIAKIGLPTSLNLVMVSLSEIAVLSFVNRFGSTAVAAYGAVNQVVSYVQFPAISIGIAASIFGAQSIGARRTDRIPTIVRSAVILNYAIEGVLIAICYAFSTALISLFITSPSTVAIAHHLLLITLWSYAIFGNTRVLSAIMISSGTVVWPTILSVLSIWGVEVPVAYVLMGRIGLDGVWYGYPAAFIAGLAFQTAYYFFVWKKKPLEALI
jgi:putative MATE family efflux protein